MKEQGPPPLPPSDANEPTVDYGRGAGALQRSVDSLLPPGADDEPAAPPLVGSGPIMAEFVAPQVGPRGSLRPPGAPTIDTMATQGAARAIRAEEREQRRFWRNVVVFGVCLVVLMVVCFLMAR